MNEQLNLLGKQQQDIITIPEWFMLHMIKEESWIQLQVREKKVSELSIQKVIAGPCLLLYLPENYPEIILSVSQVGRMKMKKTFGVNLQRCIFYD